MHYAVRRVAVAIGLVWFVATFVFLAIHLVPGDAAEMLLSQGGVAPDPATVAELREKLGLDQPLLRQYVKYMTALLGGDLGSSLVDDHPVAAEIALRLPRTLELIGAAAVLALITGLPAGTLAALRAGSAGDRALSAASGIALSIPVFVIGTLAILVFAQKLHLVPAGGYVPLARDPLGHVAVLAMPAATIAVGLGAIMFRITRSSVLDVLGRDHVRSARARGIAPRRIIMHHVLRNALIPILTNLGILLPGVFVGSFLLEVFFSIPGLGREIITAVNRSDFPVIKAVTVYLAVFTMIINLAVDVLYKVVDPRVSFK